MATATRGAKAAESEEPSSQEAPVEEAAEREELPFDFFIFPNIPRPRSNGEFAKNARVGADAFVCPAGQSEARALPLQP